MSDRRYRWLLRLLPGSFREEHEGELLRIWREERRDAALTGRRGVWRRALRDTLRVGPREYADAWRRNLRVAARTLARARAFTISTVLTLALGTGATAAIFSVVNAVLLRPLPWHEPDRVGLVWAVAPAGHRTWLSPLEVEDIRRDIAAFQSVAGFTDLTMAYAAPGAAHEFQLLGVSHDFFPLLGVRPLLGRTFHADEDTPGAARRVMLSEHVWRRQFGAAADIVGTTVRLNAEPYTVIGVVPASFEWLPASSVMPERVDAWVALEPHLPARDRSIRMVHAAARLQEGASFASATEQLRSYAERIALRFPAAYAGGEWSFEAVSFAGHVLRPARTPLLVILALVVLVLLMSCANVANLLLAQAVRRRPDIAVRTALGASPAMLAGELLAEVSLLAGAGGLLGLALAVAVPAALRALDPTALPRLGDVAVDWRVGAVMLGLLLVTIALCTLVPLVERLQVRMAPGPLGDRGGGLPPAALRAGRMLVVGQTALAATVVIATLFLAATLTRLLHVDLGVDGARVLTARCTRLPDGGPARWAPFFEAAVSRLAEEPGVTAAGAVSHLPMSGAMLASTFFAGPATDPLRIDSDLRGIAGDYFAAAGIPLLRGRTFTAADRGGAAPVAIVDDVFARSLSPEGDVIGRRIRWLRQPDVDVEIVGVVGSVRHRGPAEPARATVYRPTAQYARPSMYLVMRTLGAPEVFAPALHRAVAALDAAQPLADVATLQARADRSTARVQTSVYLAAALAILAVAMVVIGVYGVLATNLAHRSREFGVRQVLGATPGSLRLMIVRDALSRTLAGVALGAGGAWAVVRAGRAMLYGITDTSAAPYALGSVLVVGLALVACSIPAWRAGRIDPLRALR